MDTKELRPGNLVETYHGSLGWKQEEANEITYYGMGNNYGELEHSPEEIRPIPLTEEWLRKLGFSNGTIQISKHGVCSMGWYLAWRDYSKEVNLCYEYDDCAHQSLHSQHELSIKHVHSLQNLYFALTGQELKYES